MKIRLYIDKDKISFFEEFNYCSKCNVYHNEIIFIRSYINYKWYSVTESMCMNCKKDELLQYDLKKGFTSDKTIISGVKQNVNSFLFRRNFMIFLIINNSLLYKKFYNV